MSGVLEKTIEIKETVLKIYDVSGAENNCRKKWLHCFASVNALLFVCALDDIWKVVDYNNNVNSMHASLALFDEICNSKWFRNTPILLFMTKDDLFRELLLDGYSLETCFAKGAFGWDDNNDIWNGPDYFPTNENNTNVNDAEYFDMCYSVALQFVIQLYANLDKSMLNTRRVFPHVTNATDFDITESVFWDMQNITVTYMWKHYGGLV